MRKLGIILPAALLMIVGCSDQTLSMEDALKKVKEDAGVNEVNMVEQSYTDDQYHFVFEDGTNRYDYTIEEDGEFVSKNIQAIQAPVDDQTQPEATPIPRPQPGGNTNNDQGSTSETVDLSMIPTDLLTKLNVDTTTAKNIRQHDKRDDGKTYTEIEFSTDFARYEFVMDGDLLVEYECDLNRGNLNGETIDADGAIQVALDFLGISVDDVTLYDQEYDRDDYQYELEGVFADESMDFTIYENGVIHSIDYNHR